MSVGEYCTREVVVISKGSPVREAVSLMRSFHVGDVVVVDKECDKPMPVGILTDRDIVLKVMAENVDPDSVTVGDIMSYDLVTVDENTELVDVIKVMQAKGVRRMPIVDKNDALIGIVTVDDVMEIVAEQLNDIVGLVSKESGQEKKRHQVAVS